MNHKRGRPKHQRAGCDCKYWKDERMPKSGNCLPAADRRHGQPDDDVTMEQALAEVNDPGRDTTDDAAFAL